MYAEVTLILIFPMQTSEKPTPLVLHRFVILREDHSVGQSFPVVVRSHSEERAISFSISQNRYH